MCFSSSETLIAHRFIEYTEIESKIVKGLTLRSEAKTLRCPQCNAKHTLDNEYPSKERQHILCGCALNMSLKWMELTIWK